MNICRRSAQRFVFRSNHGRNNKITSETNHIYKHNQSSNSPGIDSASNRNEYQESFWRGKGRPARKADKLTAICEPIV
jgi:hypothetical protein